MNIIQRGNAMKHSIKQRLCLVIGALSVIIGSAVAYDRYINRDNSDRYYTTSFVEMIEGKPQNRFEVDEFATKREREITYQQQYVNDPYFLIEDIDPLNPKLGKYIPKHKIEEASSNKYVFYDPETNQWKPVNSSYSVEFDSCEKREKEEYLNTIILLQDYLVPNTDLYIICRRPIFLGQMNGRAGPIVSLYEFMQKLPKDMTEEEKKREGIKFIIENYDEVPKNIRVECEVSPPRNMFYYDVRHKLYPRSRCDNVFVHEWVHALEYGKKISLARRFILDLKSGKEFDLSEFLKINASNEEFDEVVGCIDGWPVRFTIEKPVTLYGYRGCAEAYADAIDIYVFLPGWMKDKRPIQYNWLKDQRFKGKEFLELWR